MYTASNGRSSRSRFAHTAPSIHVILLIMTSQDQQYTLQKSRLVHIDQ